MEGKIKYQRMFLMFNQEDAGFGTGQQPTGYVKIEVRDGIGKFTAFVQNLKEDTDRLNYKIYMMRNEEKRQKPVFVGTIPLQKGKGELKWEFNPLSVGNSGISLDSLAVIAVLAEYTDRQNISILCPLAAYRDKKTNWKDSIKNVLYSVQATDITRETDEQKCETVVQNDEDVEWVDENQEEVTEGESEEGLDDTQEDGGFREEIQNISSSPFQLADEENNERDEAEAYEQPVPETEGEDESEPLRESEEAEEDREDQDWPEEAEPEVLVYKADAGNSGSLPDEQADSADASTESIEENVNRNTSDGTGEGIDFASLDEYRELFENDAIDSMLNGMDRQGEQCERRAKGACNVQPGSQSPGACAQCSTYQSKAAADGAESIPGDVDKLRENLDKYFEPCDPFKSRRSNYKWWKVNSPVYLNNLLYQCNIRTPLLFNPKVLMSHFKYRHLIAGIYADRARMREYIVCGVPGVYSIDERPFGELCRWVQLEGYKPRYGAFGYWLVYIDPRTGKLLRVS